MDIGGLLPIPLRPSTLFFQFFSVSLIVAQFTIFGNFQVLNFQGSFEALNDVFFGKIEILQFPKKMHQKL